MAWTGQRADGHKPSGEGPCFDTQANIAVPFRRTEW